MMRCLACLLPALIVGLAACGQVRPVPSAFSPADYQPIALEQLRQGSPALAAGQLVRLPVYFWEFLSYDPAVPQYYLNQLRHPQRWRELEWFAVYQEPSLRGYFDRAAMTYEQRLQADPKRLDPITLYGELVAFGAGRLYLKVHHLEHVATD